LAIRNAFLSPLAQDSLMTEGFSLNLKMLN